MQIAICCTEAAYSFFGFDVGSIVLTSEAEMLSAVSVVQVQSTPQHTVRMAQHGKSSLVTPYNHNVSGVFSDIHEQCFQ